MKKCESISNTFLISKDTSNKIIFVQFIASIIIVLDHSFNYLGFVATTKFENIVHFFVEASGKWATNIVMPMFFTISGFLLFKNICNLVSLAGLKSWYYSKLKSRFKTLFIPFICWNSIWCIFFITIGKLGLTSGNVDTSITITNILAGIFYYKYNEVYWYVFILLIYVITSPLLYCLLKNKNLSIIFMISLIIISNITYPSNVLNLLTTFNSIFYFALGAFVAIYYPNFVNYKYNNHYILSSLALFLISITLLYFNNYTYKIITFVFRTLGMCSFWIFMDFSRRMNIRSYMKYSFYIYSMHKPVQQIFNKIFSIILPTNLISYLINFYGGTILTLIVIFIAALVLTRYFPKIFSLLNGGRGV
ncbi:MAG: acyltransferase [Ruminococcaceae bacterium]|nr:acyltransferase [Oscillospiraceae bacterium]